MAETILIVDDDPVQRRLMENMARRFGYEAIAVDGGDAAIKLMFGTDAPRVDCLVLDLVMPDLDGFEFLTRFRQSAIGRRTPVIVWTVKDLTREERRQLEAAAQAIVLKSQGTAALVEELAAYVPSPGGREARRAG